MKLGQHFTKGITRFLTIIFLLGIFGSSISANDISKNQKKEYSSSEINQLFDSTELKVWIDFIEDSDTAFVKGLVVNLTEQKRSYRWEMKVHKETTTGISDNKLNGEFVAEPFFPSMIAETEIALKKREYFVIIFQVFDQKNKLVGIDTLTSQKVNPSVTKPTISNPPLVKKDLPRPGNSLDALEIDGLILDETRSKIGRDFYEIFYNRWNPPHGAKDYLITIKELPARGLGARVSIQVNENIVLYRFLQPRGDLVEQEAGISISVVKNYLLRNENIKQDMEAGDQMGSGIY